MNSHVTCGLIFACVLPICGQSFDQPIEPKAGTWKTWIIASGSAYRVPAPPDPTTNDELNWVRGVVALDDPIITQQVAFWDAGPPSYRWIDYIMTRFLAGRPVTPYVHRVFAYVAIAMHDATIAAWDSKYAYNRPRPIQWDPTLHTRLATPRSPSYPSEHAATAAAAAGVLSYFFPDEAAALQSMAHEAARSRLYAGLQFPTDYFAGLDLGQNVAAAVVERAKTDGSDAVWTGTIPTGACAWTGKNPGNTALVYWKPFLLGTPSQFRPPPPPDCKSDEMTAQVATVRNFPRSPQAFVTNQKAMYWQGPEGIGTWPYVYANKWMFEDRTDQNPPRASRAYALLATTLYDAFIASQDGKFTYWLLRPSQLDPSIVPLFPVPNFPSYPSNHSTFSSARAEILAYLFPEHADFIRAVGKEAGDSRIWAGIHYPIDNEAGKTLGKSVAQVFIDWANSDGSQ